MKLIVSDMDGTLIQHGGISSRNLAAIHSLQNRGIEFAIASGRDYIGIRSVLDQYHIRCCSILGNGAQYCDEEGQVVMSCYLQKEFYKAIVSIFEKANVPYMVFTTNGFYTGQNPQDVQDAFIERSVRRFHGKREDYFGDGPFVSSPCNHLQKINSIDDFLNQDLDIIKVEAFSLHAQDIAPTKIKLADIQGISYLSSYDDNVEVTDQNAQKGLILKKVAQLKNIDIHDIAVLGDGMNDMSLFENFPYSFAPANAQDEIKKLAYRVVDDCQQDGFAQAIEMILKTL